MFKYEDMDFQSLTTSLDIENPDGPEELYAMAQFCRMGKGTQASEENYRFYLQRAADAGSEQQSKNWMRWTMPTLLLLPSRRRKPGPWKA